jgi:hypothetical protein
LQPKVDEDVAFEEQEERDYQDGKQRRDEPDGADKKASAGQQEAFHRLAKLCGYIVQLADTCVVEPDQAESVGEISDAAQPLLRILRDRESKVRQRLDLSDQQRNDQRYCSYHPER